MPLKRTDIHSALLKKGFDESSGRDHTFFVYYTSDGKKSQINTKTSLGTSHKDIGDPLVGQMAKQLRLTSKQFRELVGCTLDQEAYEKHLVENNHVTIPKSSDATENGFADEFGDIS